MSWMSEFRERVVQAAAEHELGMKKLEFYRDPSSRSMGSCSHDGVIRVNLSHPPRYRQQPQELEQTVSHELAHIRHFEHSPDHLKLTKLVRSTLSRIRRAGVRTQQ